MPPPELHNKTSKVRPASSKTNPAARRVKPKVRATGNSSKNSIPSTRSGWTRTSSTLFRRKSETRLSTLQTNEEREQFIEAFWQRRNPDPDSPENTFKEEHYRRIAYANEHFASGVPGWKTDRGRIYIAWGPPDERDEHTQGEQYDRPMDQGGGTTTTYAYENWRYRYAEGLGENFEMEFVDPTGTGEFHLTMDPSEKDALLNVPGAGLTMPEAMGMADKSQRFQNTDGTHLAGAN